MFRVDFNTNEKEWTEKKSASIKRPIERGVVCFRKVLEGLICHSRLLIC
jgi:hypothetical protein